MSTRTETRHVVDSLEAFGPGSSRIVKVGGRSIGLYNDDGELFAIRNVCPHHGAPLCTGPVQGTMVDSAVHEYVYSRAPEDRIVRCPWHGYEFRIHNGRSIVDPERMRVKTYRVEVEDGDVVVYV